MRKDLAGYDNFTAPGVEMHCLYGKNTGDTVDEYDPIITNEKSRNNQFNCISSLF